MYKPSKNITNSTPHFKLHKLSTAQAEKRKDIEKMPEFKIVPREYTDKATGEVRKAENIVLCMDTPMGRLEMPIKAVFASDSKLLRYAVSLIIANQ